MRQLEVVCGCVHGAAWSRGIGHAQSHSRVSRQGDLLNRKNVPDRRHGREDASVLVASGRRSSRRRTKDDRHDGAADLAPNRRRIRPAGNPCGAEGGATRATTEADGTLMLIRHVVCNQRQVVCVSNSDPLS
jgi:hypothetical protein